MLCPGREGTEVGGALSVECLPYSVAHSVAEGDLSQIPLPPPRITDASHHAWFVSATEGLAHVRRSLYQQATCPLKYTFLWPWDPLPHPHLPTPPSSFNHHSHTRTQ